MPAICDLDLMFQEGMEEKLVVAASYALVVDDDHVVNNPFNN